MARKAPLSGRAKGARYKGESVKEPALDSAMREVHENVPKNVKATGKKGKAKETMLRAIAFSKAGEKKKKSY